MKIIKCENGITILVLIITIIVIFLLTTISIKLVVNNNGNNFLNKVKNETQSQNEKIINQETLTNSAIKQVENDWGL